MKLSMTVAEIASMLGGKVIGSGDTVIRGLAKIEDASPDTVSFLANLKYSKYLETTKAGAVLVSPGTKDYFCTIIEVENPYLQFLRLLQKFYPQVQEIKTGIHPTASVDATAKISESAKIGAFCYVGPNSTVGHNSIIYPHVVIHAEVMIGENCEIHSRVSIRERVVIGNGVIIQDGAVIGSDGFGFAPSAEGYHKVPQVGRVVIADGVEIGANTTVDRATMGETVIGKGTKLDNLIQVAHNVVIGSNTVIAAQTGVSGSARIGSNCMIGGQVGFVGHIQIEDGVMIGAQSGVGHNLKQGEIVSGSPARSHSLWKRIEATITHLPELLKRVRKLESAVYGENSKQDEGIR